MIVRENQGYMPALCSISDVASELEVSQATVRNWIKARVLREVRPGKISSESLRVFRATRLGSLKLRHGANKLHFDSGPCPDHRKRILDTLSKLDSGDLRTLEDHYQECLGSSTRNREGIYYTPVPLVRRLMNCVKFSPNATSVFLDPACGTGRFLDAALKLGFAPENIYGVDTDPIALAITSKRFASLPKECRPQLIQGSFLEEETYNQIPAPSLVATNPPWGKKMSAERKRFEAKKLGVEGQLDSSALFFLRSLERLADDGQAILLLPEAFFNVAAFQAVRSRLLTHSITRIENHGKVFKGLMTDAVSIVVRKGSTPRNGSLRCHSGASQWGRRQSEFESNPKHIFNFYCPSREAKAIEKLYEIPHTTLKGKARWAMGIVTGNNREYLSQRDGEGRLPVYRGADILAESFRPAATFLKPQFDRFQQVAPLDLYTAPRKIAYRFISKKLVAACDEQQRFFLNSANLIILEEGFPLSHEVVARMLSGPVLNFVFSRVFKTKKVLRSELEQLPIFLGDHWQTELENWNKMFKVL